VNDNEKTNAAEPHHEKPPKALMKAESKVQRAKGLFKTGILILNALNQEFMDRLKRFLSDLMPHGKFLQDRIITRFLERFCGSAGTFHRHNLIAGAVDQKDRRV